MTETDDFVVARVPTRWRPYVVITAGILLHFTYGIVYTFGNLLPYLVSYLRWKVDPTLSGGSLIWIQSLMAGMPFAMLVGGYMEKRLGARKSAFIGSVLYSGSLALSYLSIQHSFFLLLITFGVMSSFGSSVAYNSVMICCQRWLPTRVGLVNGLITAGYALSAFVAAPLETRFINPLNYPVDSEGHFTQEDLLERVPQMFLLLAALFGTIQVVALLFLGEPRDYQTSEVVQRAMFAPTSTPALDENGEEEEAANGNTEDDDDDVDAGEDAPLHPATATRQRRASVTAMPTHKEIFSSDTFLLLFLTLFLNGFYVQIGAGLFKTYGQGFIHDDFFLATVNSLGAITNCFSRVFWGLAVDKTSYQTAMATATALGAFQMWTLGLVQLSGERYIFLLSICVMFACVGATYALLPYATHKCFGGRNFGIAYGCVQLSLSVAGLVTALSSQFLLPAVGFQVMFIAAGSAIFISLFITMCIHKTKYGHGTC